MNIARAAQLAGIGTATTIAAGVGAFALNDRLMAKADAYEAAGKDRPLEPDSEGVMMVTAFLLPGMMGLYALNSHGAPQALLAGAAFGSMFGTSFAYELHDDDSQREHLR